MNLAQEVRLKSSLRDYVQIHVLGLIEVPPGRCNSLLKELNSFVSHAHYNFACGTKSSHKADYLNSSADVLGVFYGRIQNMNQAKEARLKSSLRDFVQSLV